MKRMQIVLGLTLLAIAGAASAADSGFQVIPSLGRGRLLIDADQVVTNKDTDVDTIVAGVTFAYVTPIGLGFEVGGTRHQSDNLFGAFDDFRLDQGHAAIDWQIDTPNGFRIVPKVGRARWKLYSREGALFHPGPEATETVDGYEYFWELSFSKKITPTIALGASVRDSNYQFGEARSLSFIASFAL
jgi:hypothetical protein